MELAIRLTIIIQVKLKLENIADEMLPRVTSLASQILLTGTHSDVQRCNQLLDSPSFVDFLFSTAYQSVAQEEDVKAVNTDR